MDEETSDEASERARKRDELQRLRVRQIVQQVGGAHRVFDGIANAERSDISGATPKAARKTKAARRTERRAKREAKP